MTAQNKLFTLEDLNFGGTNYHAMQPKNIWLTWWGDQLVQTDVEECYTIDVKTGKKKRIRRSKTPMPPPPKCRFYLLRA